MTLPDLLEYIIVGTFLLAQIAAPAVLIYALVVMP